MIVVKHALMGGPFVGTPGDPYYVRVNGESVQFVKKSGIVRDSCILTPKEVQEYIDDGVWEVEPEPPAWALKE